MYEGCDEFDEAMRIATLHADEAARTLIKLLDSADENVRLQAAKSILELVMDHRMADQRESESWE